MDSGRDTNVSIAQLNAERLPSRIIPFIAFASRMDSET